MAGERAKQRSRRRTLKVSKLIMQMRAQTTSLKERKRQLVESAVLDAAEGLLHENADGDFSMRALAEAAGVGFTTPFNYFGSKDALLRALGERMLMNIEAEYHTRELPELAFDRVQLMNEVGIRYFLRQPKSYKVIARALNMPRPNGPDMRSGASDLWRVALGKLEGIPKELQASASVILPDQLAISFRGAITFWHAEELSDDRLLLAAKAATATLFLGFIAADKRAECLSIALECERML